jgi:hypothetical protein
VPEPPITLEEILSLRTKSTLGFSWLPGLDNGAYELIDYTVYVYDDSLTYDVTAPLLDAETTSTYTATNLALGTEYNFQVAARNQYGFSARSQVLRMLAAIKPDPPTNIVSQNVGSDAEICWTEPYDSGSPIFAYKIYIKTVTNTYEQ